MKVLVISDTHGNLPIDIEKMRIDAVIHAGDVGDREFISKFKSVRNFFVVAGNTDTTLENYIPQSLCDEIEGIRFFLVHNLSAPHRIIMSNYREIKSCDPDLVIFGHTHIPAIEKKDGMIYLNPGSLGKPGLTGKRTYAVIQAENNRVSSLEIFDADTGEVINSIKTDNYK